MEIIHHRRNTLALLQQTPTEFGVEVDIRSQGDRLIIHHDPYDMGVDFNDWISVYTHGTLILNVKEEGLEDRLLACMADRGITAFFFLDQSFPFLMRTANTGERRCAVRISEYESVDTALAIADKIDWAWIDCFTRFPLSREDGDELQKAGLKLCLVSPELQGRTDAGEVAHLRTLLDERGIRADAVCTKVPELWA